jgi:hypothetical protein
MNSTQTTGIFAIALLVVKFALDYFKDRRDNARSDKIAALARETKTVVDSTSIKVDGQLSKLLHTQERLYKLLIAQSEKGGSK